MIRTRVRYRCEGCGAEAPRWLGRCPGCGAWNSLAEAPAEEAPGPAGRPRHRSTPPGAPVPLTAVEAGGAVPRPCGVAEVDRLLGGGFVAGSVTLLGGEPGIGKSTLLLQIAGAMAARGARCLVATAEESTAQVRDRAARLRVLDPGVLLLAETSLPDVLAHAAAVRPDLLVVDSVQTVVDPDAPGSAGSVAQVRESASLLVSFAKEHAVATVIVGHVTKDGNLAGPRVLEHVVDTVLSFEGDRHHALRMLRVLKHRFGSTHELGLFEMDEEGLGEVVDPSALFLADRCAGAPGSAVVPVLEGSRPLLVEVQALVAPASAPVPRRAVQGLDAARVAMLLAVLERRGGVAVASADTFTSVAGGVRVQEAGADLALVLAVASARLDRAVDPATVVLGEVGLGGEVRQVPRSPRRLAEAARLGFRRAIAPASSGSVAGIEVVPVGGVGDALSAAGITA